jgi:hypothetical protein
VNNPLVRQKPHFLWRLLFIIAIVGFASIKNNPVVRLEAILGLSPPPIERFFGVKSLFSGMTEGVHQFVRMNIEFSVKANVFAPLAIPIAIYSILTWTFPKVDSKQKEYVFFSIFIVLSTIVNIVN